MLKLYLSPKLRHAVLTRHGLCRFLGLDKFFAPILPLSMPILNGKTTLKNPFTHAKRTMQAGFSLLEMLVVLGLLAVVMLTTTTYLLDTSDLEDERRQQETALRWEHIQQATIGNKFQYIDQSPAINSFVVDMGRLPVNLKELADRVYDDDGNIATPDKELPVWQAQPLGTNLVGSLWGGWRGPYLNRVGSQAFRDGWQNQNESNALADMLNFGWVVSPSVPQVDISVVSLGRDNAVGGTGLNEDYPSPAIPLVSANDWQLVSTSIGFNVVLNHPPSTNQTLVLRVFFIEDGVIEEEQTQQFIHLSSVAGITTHPVSIFPTAPATTVSLPMGKYAAVVWCSTASPEVVYDGDCDPENATSASPLTTLPAYYFTLLPNTPLPITIPWNLP